jgi:plastocyanin
MKRSIDSNYVQKAFAAFTIAVLTISVSCSKSSNGSDGMQGSGVPGANEVWIQNMAFNPATITVTAGTTIKWTNKDGVTHTVTSDTGVFDSGNMTGNATFSYSFQTAGTFQYHCTIHPSMTAKVIVN